MKTFLLTLPLTLLLVACGGGSGGKAGDVSANINTTTAGQELVDLKAAKDQGLLSEEEYNAARQNILKKYDE